MFERSLINLYLLVEGFGADASTLKKIVYAIGTVSELTRLAEVCLEELERQTRELKIMVDGRNVSILIKEGKMDET